MLHYLGYKGAIKDQDAIEQHNEYQYSKLNAVPLLGMYDIFKNYYSNKQEEYCYMNTGVYQVMGVIVNGTNSAQVLWDVNYGFKDTGSATFKTPITGGGTIQLRIFKDDTFTPTRAKVEERLQTILERVFVDINFIDGKKQRPATSLWELITSKEDGESGQPPMRLDNIAEVPFAIGTGAYIRVPEINQWEITLDLVENLVLKPSITSINWRRNVTIEPIKLSEFDDIREALLTKPFMQEYTFKGNDTKYFKSLS